MAELLTSATPTGERASVFAVNDDDEDEAMADDEGGVVVARWCCASAEFGDGLEDFFSFGGVFIELAASDSELVTIGLPWAACCRIFARRFLNQT